MNINEHHQIPLIIQFDPVSKIKFMPHDLLPTKVRMRSIE